MLVKLQCYNTGELGNHIGRGKERRTGLHATSCKPERLIIFFRQYAILFIPPPRWFNCWQACLSEELRN